MGLTRVYGILGMPLLGERAAMLGSTASALASRCGPHRKDRLTKHPQFGLHVANLRVCDGTRLGISFGVKALLLEELLRTPLIALELSLRSIQCVHCLNNLALCAFHARFEPGSLLMRSSIPPKR